MIRLLLVFISILSTCENCLKRLHRKEILSSFLQLLIQIQNILVGFFLTFQPPEWWIIH